MKKILAILMFAALLSTMADFISDFQAAETMFKQRKWADAAGMFEKLEESANDDAGRNRCRVFAARALVTHSPADSNPEHSCTALLVYNAFLAAREKGGGGGLLFWPEVTSTGISEVFGQWNTFINTDGYFSRKVRAIGIHACQAPRPESLELEDSIRGKICGCQTAEVFSVCQAGGGGEFSREILDHLRYSKYSL